MTPDQLSATAQLSAHRALIVQLYVLALLQEPDPVGAARIVRLMHRRSPVRPPRSGTPLNPAVSDLLASMADEEIESVMEEIEEHLAARPGSGQQDRRLSAFPGG